MDSIKLEFQGYLFVAIFNRFARNKGYITSPLHIIIRRGDVMGCYEQFRGNQLIILSALISLSVSGNLSSDQLNTLGNFIVATGSLLLTKAAQIHN